MPISFSEGAVDDNEAPFSPTLLCILLFVPFVCICSITVFYQGQNMERGPLVGSGEKKKKKKQTSEES